MLAHRLRRLANINPALVQDVLFTGELMCALKAPGDTSRVLFAGNCLDKLVGLIFWLALIDVEVWVLNDMRRSLISEHLILNIGALNTTFKYSKRSNRFKSP